MTFPSPRRREHYAASLTTPGQHDVDHHPFANPPSDPSWIGNYLGGDDSERDLPVPIPNTEVKPLCADGTARVTVWESRSSPPSSIDPPVETESVSRGVFWFLLRSGRAFRLPRAGSDGQCGFCRGDAATRCGCGRGDLASSWDLPGRDAVLVVGRSDPGCVYGIAGRSMANGAAG